MKINKNIKVAIRLRPSEQTNLTYTNKDISFDNQENVCFTFDRVFDPYATNQQVHDYIASPIVQKALQGYNGTVFAYGQTTSGKTHTIIGDNQNPGIIPISLQEIFSSKNRGDAEIECWVSFLEIYNEQINDLLAASSTNLKIREDPVEGSFVSGLKQVKINNLQQALDQLRFGDQNRQYKSTRIHDHSSRSHCVFRILIETNDRQGSVKDRNNDLHLKAKLRFSVLNIVDLAGSERMNEAQANTSETKYINTSLFELAKVVKILSEKQGHVPYRNSKLTRILSNALGGNCLTGIICNIAPEERFYQLSLSTLRFAQRAKNVKTAPVQNTVYDDSKLIGVLKAQINHLQLKLQKTKTAQQQKKVDENKQAANGFQQKNDQGKQFTNNTDNPFDRLKENFENQNTLDIGRCREWDDECERLRKQFDKEFNTLNQKYWRLMTGIIKKDTNAQSRITHQNLRSSQGSRVRNLSQGNPATPGRSQNVNRGVFRANIKFPYQGTTQREVAFRQREQQINYNRAQPVKIPTRINIQKRQKSSVSRQQPGRISISVPQSNQSLQEDSPILQDSPIEPSTSIIQTGKTLQLFHIESDSDQENIPDYRPPPQKDQIEQSENAIQIKLQKGGNVFLWGLNNQGSCGVPYDGSTEDFKVLRYQFSSVVCGQFHTALIDKNQILYTIGKGGNGQLGTGSLESTFNPIPVTHPIQGVQIKLVACGWTHTLCASVINEVYSWGNNFEGQLGIGDFYDRCWPSRVIGQFEGAIDISCGRFSSALIDTNGKLFTWGSNPDGRLCYEPIQLAHQKFRKINRPQLVLAMKFCKQVSMGTTHSIVMDTDGSVYTSGSTDFGQLGVGRNFDYYRILHKLTQFTHINPAVKVVASDHYSAILTQQGTIYTFGKGSYGKLGLGTFQDMLAPTKIKSEIFFTDIACGARHMLARDAQGELYAWGDNYYYQQGIFETQEDSENPICV